MSGTLDPMSGIERIARSMRSYEWHRYADPHLACLPVLVPTGVEGLVLCLASDAVNDGRRIDPYVVVAHWESADSMLLVARSYLQSTLRWRKDSIPEKQHRRLLFMAGVAYRDPQRRHEMPRPLRHAI